MSTTPAVPITPAKPAAAAQSWLQKHERIIIVLIICTLGAWGIQRYFDHGAEVASAHATVAEAKAATADATAAKDEATLAQVNQQYLAMLQTLTAQNQQLATALSARQAQVVVQQKVDTTLAPAALADRISTLANAPSGTITLDGANISLARPGAVAVAQSLELIPVLQANLKDETQIAVNTQTALNKSDGVISDYRQQVLDLNTARTADATACKAEIAQVKATSRKNNLKWFKRGLFVGFLGGIWAGHAAGL